MTDLYIHLTQICHIFLLHPVYIDVFFGYYDLIILKEIVLLMYLG